MSTIQADFYDQGARERGLTDNDERFIALIENSSEAIWLLARDGTILYTSPSVTRILGYRADELLGSNIFEFTCTDDSLVVEDLLAGLIREPSTAAVVRFRVRHRDGSWRLIECTAANRLDLPAVQAIVLNCKDVTHLKALEDAAQIGRYLSVLIEHALHITAIIADGGVIQYVSPAVERMLGYSPASLIGQNLFELIHEEDAANVRDRLTHPGVGQVIEFRFRHRDGSCRVLEAIATNHLDDVMLAGIVINARDVTERKWTAELLRRSLDALLAIHDAGQVLGSNLEQDAIGTALLESVARVASVTAGLILVRNERGHLRVWQTLGAKQFWARARRARNVMVARQQAFECGAPQFFWMPQPRAVTAPMGGWCLPLRVHQRMIGVLEVYGPGLADPATGETLDSLGSQAAAALEGARLHREVAERERRLQDVVGQLLLAQEDERRRVAYEVHDGLAQLAAAAQQHLEAFSAHYRPRNSLRRAELDRALELAKRTVGEARHVIAGLRPTALDDFGLASALRAEVDALAGEGWQIEYREELGDERLPPLIETALYRVAQEALANVRKHAQTTHACITLERRGETVGLTIRDWGRGFRPAAVLTRSRPGERVGLVGMQERIALLGGRFAVRSRPGWGTQIRIDIPVESARRQTERQ